jgi:hypothetical protein
LAKEGQEAATQRKLFELASHHCIKAELFRKDVEFHATLRSCSVCKTMVSPAVIGEDDTCVLCLDDKQREEDLFKLSCGDSESSEDEDYDSVIDTPPTTVDIGETTSSHPSVVFAGKFIQGCGLQPRPVPHGCDSDSDSDSDDGGPAAGGGGAARKSGGASDGGAGGAGRSAGHPTPADARSSGSGSESESGSDSDSDSDDGGPAAGRGGAVRRGGASDGGAGSDVVNRLFNRLNGGSVYSLAKGKEEQIFELHGISHAVTPVVYPDKLNTTFYFPSRQYTSLLAESWRMWHYKYAQGKPFSIHSPIRKT